jgi:hypothetical protein
MLSGTLSEPGGLPAAKLARSPGCTVESPGKTLGTRPPVCPWRHNGFVDAGGCR